MALHDEPTRRLGEHKSTASDEDSEHDLEGDGEPPLDGAVDIRETEIEPVSDEGTDGDDSTLEADEETTVVSTRTLRLPDGNSSGVHAVSKTGNDTSDNELAQSPVRSERSSRDDSTEDHEKTTGDKERCATNTLTVSHCEDSTEEATEFVTGSDSTTEDGDMFGVTVESGEFRSKLVTRNDTRHQTLIITEKGESNDGCKCNGDMELLAP
jgi:hypothetical protein